MYVFCDGPGMHWYSPSRAIEIEQRGAEPYNKYKVMENVAKAGPNVIKAHLKHLYDHEQTEFLNQAIDFLRKKKY